MHLKSVSQFLFVGLALLGTSPANAQKTRNAKPFLVQEQIGGVEPMLQSHLGICLHPGLSETQLRQALSLIGTHVGKAEAEAGQAVLTRVLATRRQAVNRIDRP